jgi:hypothetical protein
MRDTTIRSRILALIAPGEWITTDTIRDAGNWTDKVFKDIGGHLAGMAYNHVVETRRVLVSSPAKGERRVRIEYRIPPVDKVPVMAAPPAAQEHRPLVTDLAAWALANPPRGRSTVVPSMANAALRITEPDHPMRRRAC